MLAAGGLLLLGEEWEIGYLGGERWQSCTVFMIPLFYVHVLKG